MTGIVGGTTTGETLRTMIAPLEHESWYECDRFESDEYGLGVVHHGKTDPDGAATWDGDSGFGVVYGAVTNCDGLGLTTDEMFERVLDRPTDILPALDGSFSIAAIGRNPERVIVATDKLGARPCFYTTVNGLFFCTELKSVLGQLADPTIDEQAVNDLLMMGRMWGDETLVEEISAIPPATFLEHEGGETSLTRYWKPETYEFADPTDRYVHDLVSNYERIVRETADTTTGSVGLWLSGGLDSRAMLSELDRSLDRELFTYTYDANPANGGNPKLARRLARVKNTGIEEVPLTADAFVDVVEHAVDIVDGMLPWHTLKNISAVFNVENDDPGVILEAAGQGELLGEHPLRYQVVDCDSAVESMYLSETPSLGDPERVSDLLSVSVDPRGSFKEAVRNTDETDQSHTVLDAHFQNHYARFVYASNQVARSRVGTRVPFADGDFLNHIARMPPKFRLGTVPFSGGLILYGTSRPKLRLIRSLDAEFSAIPYQRTRLPPSYPYPAHIVSYVLTNGVDYLRSEPVLGGLSIADEWIRDHQGMRELIGGYVDDACDRPLFDGDEIRELYDEHLRADGNHVGLISAITTIEMWLQRQFDEVSGA